MSDAIVGCVLTLQNLGFVRFKSTSHVFCTLHYIKTLVLYISNLLVMCFVHYITNLGFVSHVFRTSQICLSLILCVTFCLSRDGLTRLENCYCNSQADASTGPSPPLHLTPTPTPWCFPHLNETMIVKICAVLQIDDNADAYTNDNKCLSRGLMAQCHQPN